MQIKRTKPNCAYLKQKPTFLILKYENFLEKYLTKDEKLNDFFKFIYHNILDLLLKFSIV